jgi:hypothetical protein
MSNLPSILDTTTLEQKLENAIEIDEEIENPDGTKTKIPDSVRKQMQMKNVADTLAEYISETSMRLPEIRTTELMFGSGETGRQSQLYLKPEPDVSKDEVRDIAFDLKNILNSVFPMEFLVGITVERDESPFL